MKAKSSAHYQREYRKRLREQGLIKKEVWIFPDNAGQLSALEKQLRVPGVSSKRNGVNVMTESNHKSNDSWTTSSLYEALKSTDLFVSERGAVELIDGVDPSLHIVMREYGDLPVFLTVSGDQIIVESVLWSTEEVAEVDRFNDAILRTHKYFPLSTISLDNLGKNGDYYHMFGALSSTSILASIVFEIEVLANNVIQATEVYAEYLSIPVEASS